MLTREKYCIVHSSCGNDDIGVLAVDKAKSRTAAVFPILKRQNVQISLSKSQKCVPQMFLKKDLLKKVVAFCVLYLGMWCGERVA